MTVDVIARLRAELGDVVSFDAAALDVTRDDRSGWRSATPPIAVVHATSVEHVQATMRIATATSTPVVPRGAGTGLAGGAIGRDRAIVVDVSGMDRILEIDTSDEFAVVEPGVINDDLDRALAPHGLWFPPDPASKAISTIGGNIATNAGGLLCAKYGVTREAVLGLAVVLADGRLLRTGRRTVKGVTGYDLTALLTGSEGTLGIIVEATVRVRPVVAGATVTLAAAFPDIESAAFAAAAVTASRVRPAVLELMDAASVARVAEYLGPDALAGTPLETIAPGAAFLLAQTDGAAAAAEADDVEGVLEALGAGVVRSADDASGERLLAIRRAFHGALASRGQVLIEDVAVPRSRMAAMFRAIEGIAARSGLEIPTIAHAGDGNLHPNFVFDADEVPESVWRAADELFRTARELGGTLTGEHGVGLLKQRWLADEVGDDSFELQRGIKAVFDPLGLMNPGVMFARAGEPVS